MATCVAETCLWFLHNRSTYTNPSVFAAVFNLLHASNQCIEYEACQIKSFFDARHPFQLVSFCSKPQITQPTQDPKVSTGYTQFSSIELLLKVTIPVQYRNWTYLNHVQLKFIVIKKFYYVLQNNFVPSKLNSTDPLATLGEQFTTVMWWHFLWKMRVTG